MEEAGSTIHFIQPINSQIHSQIKFHLIYSFFCSLIDWFHELPLKRRWGLPRCPFNFIIIPLIGGQLRINIKKKEGKEFGWIGCSSFIERSYGCCRSL